MTNRAEMIRDALTPTLLAAALLCALVAAAAGCGDEQEADPDAITCGSDQGVKTVGEVGDVPGNFSSQAASGRLNDQRITIDMGEIPYTPPGAEEAEMRPRIITFGTNQPPNVSTLRDAIVTRIDEMGEEGRTFTVVEKPLDEYCPIEEGKICARFGLDDTDNRVLDNDKVIHAGVEGTVTFTSVTSVHIAGRWDIEFGPNIATEFDESSGSLQGCFDAEVGGGLGDNVYPLE